MGSIEHPTHIEHKSMIRQLRQDFDPKTYTKVGKAN